ncbi:DNA-binding response regulator [Rhodococcoides trifolii]|uniref:DNA-binding response regulator n=1 Tax=Rhodococcoides trifolii TaxID=908250 RepID=A0A917FPI7_9NOCA|nr:DNA-binding response regulator [Rhodococcus trifolii]
MIRVALVDDQELLRVGFRMVLRAQDGIEVVAEAGSGEEALDVVPGARVDVVLMDIRMPGMGGIDATRKLVTLPSPPKVLVLTTFDLDEYVYDSIEAGASGFLLKDVPSAELVYAIRVVAAGDAIVAPSTTRRLLARFTAPARTPDGTSVDTLTDREREVLVLLAGGASNAEIASSLFVAEATVKTHVHRILTKLDLRDRVQAVVFAYEIGLVLPG